eukprot:m.581825 g.581825  ORF g.581825 m.581825 type:complete len:131 (+) comp22334_c1_seq3:101-493(+)
MTPLGSVFRAKVSAVYVVALACVVTCVTWCACADGPDGKNNGTVEGVQYFRCKLNYGLFVRPSACVVLPQESSSSLSSSGGLSQQRVVWLTCVCVLLCTDVCMCVFCSVLQYIVIMGVCVFVCRRVRVSM